jgi:hypothetical protein
MPGAVSIIITPPSVSPDLISEPFSLASILDAIPQNCPSAAFYRGIAEETPKVANLG